MSRQMRWSHDFVKHLDTGTYYFGNTVNDNGHRGFLIYEDGSWTTSFFKNKQMLYATIAQDGISFKNKYFYFVVEFQQNGYLEIKVMNDGCGRSLNFHAPTGVWNYRNNTYYNNSSKQVYCQVISEEEQFINSIDKITGKERRIAPLKLNAFKLTGEIYKPSKVPLPSKIHYGVSGEKEEYESIFTGYTGKGLLMLAENDGGRYYGESYEGKPSGYGVSIADLSTFYSITFDRYKRMEVLGRPVINNADSLYFEIFSYKNSDENQIKLRDHHNNEIIIRTKDNTIILTQYNENGDSIRIDENFENITIRYRGGSTTTYPLFIAPVKETPKPAPTPIKKETPKPVTNTIKKVEVKPTPTPIKKAEIKPTPTPLKKVAPVKELPKKEEIKQSKNEKPSPKIDITKFRPVPIHKKEVEATTAKDEIEEKPIDKEPLKEVEAEIPNTFIMHTLKMYKDLSKEKHLAKFKGFYQRLIDSVKGCVSYYSESSFNKLFDALTYYFASFIDIGQRDDIYRYYKEVTNRDISELKDKVLNVDKDIIVFRTNKLRSELSLYNHNAYVATFNLGLLILSLNNIIAKEGEKALKQYQRDCVDESLNAFLNYCKYGEERYLNKLEEEAYTESHKNEVNLYIAMSYKKNYLDVKDNEEYINKLTKLSSKGYVEAKAILGYEYYTGVITTKDEENGKSLVKEALDNGSVRALGAYGYILIKEKDIKAMDYLKKGVELHDPLCAYLMARYERGFDLGNDIDFDKALYYYELALMNGSDQAMKEVATMTKKEKRAQELFDEYHLQYNHHLWE